jgi:hypothetical protein
MARPRLIALDLDGTLLREDRTIADVDRQAIARALAAGVMVTFATGRLRGGAWPLARELGLTAPLITADGGLLVAGDTGQALERVALGMEHAVTTMAALRAHDLAPFVFTDDVIHCDEPARHAHPYVATWSPQIEGHDDVARALAWHAPHGVAAALGIGVRAGVDAVRVALSAALGSAGQLAWFPTAREAHAPWVVRVQPSGINKGRALSGLAARLGLARDEVAAVGDWVNDLEMLVWAGTSFAMGQAPRDVRQVASVTLEATSARGGGVAEALRLWAGL